VEIAADATLVLAAVLAAMIGLLNPPALHCSIITMRAS
jgi:hypothetical protein